MAELNEVFIFNKDLYVDLPLDEGKVSIYGVRPSYMFKNEMMNGLGNSRVFKRDTLSQYDKYDPEYNPPNSMRNCAS